MSEPATGTAVTEPGRGPLLGRLPGWAGSLAALTLLVIGVSLLSPAFLKPANLINILHSWSFVGIVALGMTFVIIVGGIDLSVGSLVALAGGLGVWMMNTAIEAQGIVEAVDKAVALSLPAPYGPARVAVAKAFQAMGLAGSEWAGVLVGMVVIGLVGLVGGLLNGVLVVRGRLAPFIATLGTLAAYRSLALSLADGGEFRSASATCFERLGVGGITLPFLLNDYGKALVLPWPVLVFAAMAAAMAVVLHRTRYGRYVYAIGSNERAAQYAAVRVDAVKLATYALMGLLAGVAAMLNSSRMNSVSSSQTGMMWELDAIAAVAIGGTRMSGGAGTILGTVIGLLMLGVIGNMLNLLQVSPYLQGLVKGAIIIAAVLFQRPRRAE